MFSGLLSGISFGCFGLTFRGSSLGVSGLLSGISLGVSGLLSGISLGVSGLLLGIS